ncbi:dna repair protein rhp42-like protein [Dermatophagoides farinae]|uniref:Dna repair protein rhp42-like protein n=1 Tax=Dermatophagoides farinae TaxID=6954 RepID=A0A9D4SGR5_DERFA|nr:dna repair protein rhp42-like protein [Dermatophagoides farinae]
MPRPKRTLTIFRSKYFPDNDEDSLITNDDDNNDDYGSPVTKRIRKQMMEKVSPELPAKIQISLDSSSNTKTKKNIDPIQAAIRQRINRIRKENQLTKHKCCILFAINRLQYLNSLIQDPMTQALALSMNYLMPDTKLSLEKYIGAFIAKFTRNFTISILENHDYSIDVQQEIIHSFDRLSIDYYLILKLIIIAMLRLTNHMIRLCYLFDPLPIKPSNLLGDKPKSKSTNNNNDDDELTQKEFYWIEIFDNGNNRWICYDYQHRIYDNPRKLAEKFPTKPTYILAIDNRDNIVEVTARYAKDWMSNSMQKRRINKDDDGCWLEETLNLFNSNHRYSSKYKHADHIEFEQIIAQIELPKKMAEYKNHPLFVLTKDLLKFQAIYPGDAPPLGFFRDQPVYSRNCVYTLKSRETWLREARTVRMNEQPYKMVQSRFKWKTTTAFGEKPEKEMIGVYGEWQTIPYEPPIAKNGIVPRNGYGNVDLYKQCMLPIGTVHLQLAGLLRIANKLNIDCSPAIVGFDGNRNSSHPIIDGYVVCEEYKDILIDAWNEDQHIQCVKENEKREKRIIDNWKRLIRGLIIKRNLKIKYGH